VRRVAEDLGYDADWPVDVHGGHPAPVTPVTPVTPAVAAEDAAAPDAPIPVVPRSQRIQASPAQGRLLFLDEFFPGLAVYNLPVALRLEGTFDRGAWTSSLSEIVRRHEILRTNYESVDGVYVQQIEPPSPVAVRYEDLRELPRADLDETIEREVAAEVATPFDLAHDLKLRAAVFQVGDDVHVVVLTMHHIASDGWSVLRTIGELITLYRASVSGGVAAVPEPTIQYADYAAWQRDRLQSPALQRQLAYWTEQLAGDLPVLELPTDRPRPTPRSYRSDVHLFEVPGDLAGAIRAHSRTVGATPFMTLLAAYAATLARYTGQRDVIIGTANANRQRPELTDLIGLFVNTLALRVVVDPDAPFDELLGRVRRVALDANRNQDVPFDRIVEAVRPPRDVSRSPIYQTMFTLHNMRPVEVQLPGVEVEALPVSTGELDVDLSIELTDVGGATGGAMQGMLRFNADLFDPASVERLVGSWLSLLASVVTDGSVPVGSVDLVGDGDVESVERWNATEVDLGVEGGLRVEELFAAQVRRSPDAVAVAAGETECSFVELDAASNRLAHRLLSAGVAPGDVVGVGVDRSVSMVVALLAVMKTGAAYVPLDPGFPAQRLSFMVSDAGVSVVVTSGSALLDRLGADDAAIVEGLSVIDVLADADEIDAESADPVKIAGSGGADRTGLDPSGLAYLIYTSGSTGVPKGVQIEHRNVVNFLLSMREQPGLSADDVLLAVTTLSFDISVLEIFLPLVTGARLVLARTDDSIDGSRLARLITTSQATVMQATPTTWSMLIEAGWDGEASLKVLCGGEAMSRWLADELVSRCGELWNMFGPTETTIWSTLMRIQPDDAGTVPIGAPIANTVCRILDHNGVRQPVGVPGELHIGGAGVARGYLDRPELTAERFIADPYSDDPEARLYRTGDLARWRNDGLIDFAGRLDHQVKVRGHRIELGEIETALRDRDDIGDAVVIVREDQPGDQRITAYLTAATTTTGEGDAAPTPDTGELRRYLAGTLPAYMIPSTFVTLDEFPLTPNRKIDRNVLPAPRLDTTTTTGDHVEPTTDLEHVVAGMFASLLGVEPIGTTDNFFELGGHSLLATSFAARLRAVFGIDLDLRIFFQDATVAAVVAHFSEDDDERKRIERIARIELQLASLTPDQVATLLAAKRDERGGGTEQ
jgi:amino acid adenylation domain-containing protein